MLAGTAVDAEAFVPIALVREAASGGGTPSALARELGIARDDEPTAVLFRQVATPNFETLWFVKKATRLGFHPVIVEYHADQFSVHNPYKRSLAVLPVVERRNIHGQPIIKRHQLLPVEASDRLPLRDLVLPSGETLPDFHQGLFRKMENCLAFRTVDLSRWFTQQSKGALWYYPEFLSLFSGNLVLFEDFATNRSEADFFNRVVHPAYEKASARLGRRPLITRLFAQAHRATSPLCYAYPSFVTEVVACGQRGMR
jgi:hypothetical protein